MTWLFLSWLAVAAVLFAGISFRERAQSQLLWSAMLCALWPVLLAGFVVGTALWLASSLYHALRRLRR